MSHIAIPTTGSVAAQERYRRQLLEREEEEMTQYTRDDLSSDWEFKIVRATTPAFRKPKDLNNLIEEEARAGWIMLEKLDDSRVRFKRPHRARAQDAYLPDGIDPYRTHYGAAPTQQVIMVLLFLGLLTAVGLGLAVFLLTSL